MAKIFEIDWLAEVSGTECIEADSKADALAMFNERELESVTGQDVTTYTIEEVREEWEPAD